MGIFQAHKGCAGEGGLDTATKTDTIDVLVAVDVIVAVAAFNIVSSLVMLVQDKQADIAILRTLGMSPAQVMQVFTVQGLVIGLVGVALGTLGGVLLSNNLGVLVRFIESLTGNELLPADVYYISGGVPSVVNPTDVFIIVSVAIIMCLLATIYPAWRAARTNPVEALRYE